MSEKLGFKKIELWVAKHVDVLTVTTVGEVLSPRHSVEVYSTAFDLPKNEDQQIELIVGHGGI